MPFWRRDLAAVVLTGPDAARLPGQVAALARYRPGLALAPPDLPRSGTAGEWRRLIGELGVPLRPLRPNIRLDLGGGAALLVLGHAPGDEGGAVLMIEYGAARVLLHGGGPLGDLAALVYPWQRELDTPLIAALRPQALLFTDTYAAAAPALLSYRDRRRFSPALYHRKNNGGVALISDGRRAWIEAER
jgi:hypothetical protein